MLRHFKIFVKCELPILVCFVGLALLIYQAALNGPFIWDDEGQIVQNILLRKWDYWPRFFSSGTFYNGGTLSGLFFRPFMLIYFSIIYLIGGLHSFVFHITQLAIHIVNSWIVYQYIKRIIGKATKSKLIALLVGCMFLVHPVQVEAVTYISNSQEMLFFFFGISSLYILTLAIKPSVKYPIVTILLMCSMLSKESGILFILLHLVYVGIYSRQHIKYMLLSAGTVVLIYGLLRCNLAHLCLAPTGISPILSASLTQRLINIPLLFQTYLGLIFYPYTLVSSRHWIVTVIDINHFYIPLVSTIGSITCLILGYHNITSENKRHYVFFFLWFFIGIALHLHIVALDFTLAERWLYMPMVGILMMIYLFLASKIHIKKIIILSEILLLFASVRSYVRVQDWKDPYTLFKRDSLHSSEAYDLKNNLGVELFKKHKYTEATEQFYLSTRIAPRTAQGWLNLGIMYEAMNKPASAAAAYKEGMIKSNYPYAFIYDNYATLLIRQKKYDEAKIVLAQAIRLFPAYREFVTLYNQLNEKNYH